MPNIAMASARLISITLALTLLLCAARAARADTPTTAPATTKRERLDLPVVKDIHPAPQGDHH